MACWKTSYPFINPVIISSIDVLAEMKLEENLSAHFQRFFRLYGIPQNGESKYNSNLLFKTVQFK